MGRTYIDGNTVRTAVSEKQSLGEGTLVVEKHGRRHQLRLYRDRYDGQLRLCCQEDRRIIAPLLRRIPAPVIDGGCRAALAAAVLLVFLSCYQCVHLDTLVSAHLSTIETKQSTLSGLRTQNADLRSKVNDAVNPAQIYRDAVQKYGMVRPTQDEVIEYKKSSDPGYIRQYDTIPKEKS